MTKHRRRRPRNKSRHFYQKRLFKFAIVLVLFFFVIYAKENKITFTAFALRLVDALGDVFTDSFVKDE